MKAKKSLALMVLGCLLLSLAACSSEPTVYVQSVAQLMGYGGIAPGDQFGGVVVSEFVAEIEKDGDRAIEELLVQEGDDVKEGDPLFSYDTEELQLTLDKQKLELEQMKASILSYEEQIKKMEKEMNRVSGTAKLQYSVQIQTTQVDLKETQLKIKTKEAEVKKSEEIMEHATVMAPVTGRVQAINESGTNQEGEPAPYITIQKTGAYRIKGVIGELQRGSITEGTRIKIVSRTDKNAVWHGTVTLVDFENPIQNQNMGMMMGGSDGQNEMTNTSQYPFYIKLDTTEGLIMGQHVYLQLDSQEEKVFDVAADGAFLSYEEDGSAYVWAENSRGKLEKRQVTLGDFDEMRNLYEVTAGLTREDYIAFPDASCVPGAVVSHEPVEAPEGQENADDMGGVDAGIMPDMENLDLEDLGIDEEAMEELETMDLSGADIQELEEAAEEFVEELGETEASAQETEEGGV